jgi:hypothetical protein
MRRPIWLGAGIVLGVGGTLWAEQRVRRAVQVLSPSVAGNEAVQAAKEMGGRVRDAVGAAREERRRHEAELWRRMGEVPRARAHGGTPGSMPTEPGPRGGRRRHR